MVKFTVVNRGVKFPLSLEVRCNIINPYQMRLGVFDMDFIELAR